MHHDGINDQSIAIASRVVRSGDADPVVAGGVESMSRAPFVIPKASSAYRVTSPNGGAIALGHPLGAGGARIALTAAIELHDRGVHRALATMRIGVGQGISVLLESA